jgi:hypothetical protein
LASIVHVPAPWKLTLEPEVFPESVQIDLLVASIVRTTGSPEAPPVAVTVYGEPPTVALVGAVEVKVIVWEPLPTANDCCFCNAGS